jgi:hypothetical protein
MAIAKICPEKQQGKKRTSELSSEVTMRYVNKARTVIAYAPDLVNGVLNGAVALNDAYEQAKQDALHPERFSKRREALDQS